jgi:hypothetical protein
MTRRALALVLASAVLGLAPAARAEPWAGAFGSGFGFFVGGGAGGGFARLKLADESESRWAATLPVTLRAGFDLGRYGLAVLIDTQYVFLWAPARDQGPTPAERHGRMEFLSVVPTVLFRPISPVYVSFGAGAAITAQEQTVLVSPAPVRPEITAALGFIYRFAPKSGNGSPYPAGLTVSLESRFYLPWDERFLHFQLLAVLTVYLVLTGR